MFVPFIPHDYFQRRNASKTLCFKSHAYEQARLFWRGKHGPMACFPLCLPPKDSVRGLDLSAGAEARRLLGNCSSSSLWFCFVSSCFLESGQGEDLGGTRGGVGLVGPPVGVAVWTESQPHQPLKPETKDRPNKEGI
ncbi:hypothetical protein KIL84_009820 [Mauremys mutica]|uniref:Uncharacterized protein n=1 Tax=Mauremys mutica TaxID=74926 RepID=A0A9D3XLK0_9SAUR|nr:hypothetical protein KIL84_009820 [Mauremys mutica]